MKEYYELGWLLMGFVLGCQFGMLVAYGVGKFANWFAYEWFKPRIFKLFRGKTTE